MVIVYLITGVIVIAGFAMVILSHLRVLKMTSEASGEVLAAEERVVRDERERREETQVTCRFSVQGKEYRVMHTFRGRCAARYPQGRQVTVRYNPAQPAMAKLAAP